MFLLISYPKDMPHLNIVTLSSQHTSLFISYPKHVPFLQECRQIQGLPQFPETGQRVSQVLAAAPLVHILPDLGRTQEAEPSGAALG